ncbi:MAG: M28 family peptidase [Nitrospiraceae bacterium]|nr:M28 family peptidase [Nitrospiraceae bacterium]
MTNRLLAHLRALVGERHPHTAAASLLAAEEYLSDQFQRMGYEVERHAFEGMGGVYRNIVAELPAAVRPSGPPLLVGAHYDTVPGSPGADDNASALAVLLESASVLSREPMGRPIRWIAFCLEEEDLIGSRAYAAALKRAHEQLAGAIILECVGYARSEAGTQMAPPHVPIAVPTVGNFLAVIGNQTALPLVGLLTEAGRQTVSELPLIPLVVPGRGEQLPDTRRSDHAAFWDEGYPAIMLTDTANFRNPHYHKSTDTIDTLNLEFVALVTRLVTDTARRWAAVERHDT